MKTNIKALQLIEKGLSSNTVSRLTESQIDILHKRMFAEQTMVSKTDTTTINQLKTQKMHDEAKHFTQYVKNVLPTYFENKIVLDVGSGDLNGNNRF